VRRRAKERGLRRRRAGKRRALKGAEHICAEHICASLWPSLFFTQQNISIRRADNIL
jgi:hypothetical protein